MSIDQPFYNQATCTVDGTVRINMPDQVDGYDDGGPIEYVISIINQDEVVVHELTILADRILIDRVK